MPENDDQHQEESAPIRELREKNKQLEAQLAEAAEAKRQLAFVRAGVDLDSKVGQLFYKAYDGELDVEALKAEAAELGALSGTKPPAKSEDEGHSDEEQRSTDERQGLATGYKSEEARGPHPKDVALKAGRDALDQGARNEDAIGEAFRIIAEAGFRDKDDRVIVK